jgi:GT2 family glycosyltransferase
MEAPRILIGVPAFRGARFIRDALESIQQQDHGDFRVLISVDGNDTETAVACESFLSDSRFYLVMQNHRLGWAGNLNWLMSQQDYDFFCFWQQDDFTTSNYIAELLKAATADPSAVCCFSDIQWVGLRHNLTITPSVTGSPLDRALSVFETMNGAPLRGLIRKSAIERVGPIRLTELESAFEEFVWVARLAREGNLHRVRGPIYYKRAHPDSTHDKWHAKDNAWKRAVWLEFGVGMLETILPVVPESENIAMLALVLDRLCIPRGGRFLFFHPASSAMPFAVDFLAKVSQRFSSQEIASAISRPGRDATISGRIGSDLFARAIDWPQLRNATTEDGPLTFRFAAGELGTNLLLSGWSFPEDWGTWSDGSSAALHLGVVPKSGRWRAILTFRIFGPRRKRKTIGVRRGEEVDSVNWRAVANQIVQQEIIFQGNSEDTTLHFSFPDAQSPLELGMSKDPRKLGVGLIALEISRIR